MVEQVKKIKLLYISPRDMLKARSDPIHIMASCKWFRRSGLDVELLAPYYYRPENIPEHDLYETYGIAEKDRFLITHLPTKLTDDSSKNSVRVKKLISFTWDAIKRFLFKREYRKYTKYIVFSKCYLSFLPLYYLTKIFRIKNVVFVFEAAAFMNQPYEKNILRKFSYLVAISPFLKKDIVEVAKISDAKIIVPVIGPDDAHTEYMNISRVEARKKIGFSEDIFIAAYSGKIYCGENSEIALILRAAQKIPDVTFIFTGGKPEAIEYFKNMSQRLNLTKIYFTGFFASQIDTFPYLRAADVLISFYPKFLPTLKYGMPGKILEYALAKTIIVSARYPIVEYMVGKDGALFVEPENVEALAEAIINIKTKKVDAERIAANAYKKISMHSYEKRTADILTFVLS